MTSPPSSRTTDFTDLGVLDCELDRGLAHRAAIGLLVLATDQTIEHEFRRLLPADGIGLYAARLYNDVKITNETLRAMRDRIAPAASLILPGLSLDVIGFGCTSASMALGEETVFAEIRKARPGVTCTTPVTAAIAAFAALGAGRIGVLTPYSRRVNETVRAYLASRGVDVAAFATFDKEDDRDAARISPASVAAGIRSMARRTRLEAIFVSCTSLRLSEIVAEVERDIGIPVTSSDHALAWHCLRLAGIGEAMPQAGRLFGAPLAATG